MTERYTRTETATLRRRVRIAKEALQRIRDYEPGAHVIARDALLAMGGKGITVGNSHHDGTPFSQLAEMPDVSGETV